MRDEKSHILASCHSEIHRKMPPSYKIAPETLEKVSDIMGEDIDKVVSILKILSEPIRLRILKALRIKDLCVCVFVELMDCEYSKLSYHLKLLKEAGLVDCTKEGNFLIYYLTGLGEKMLESVEKTILLYESLK